MLSVVIHGHAVLTAARFSQKTLHGVDEMAWAPPAFLPRRDKQIAGCFWRPTSPSDFSFQALTVKPPSIMTKFNSDQLTCELKQLRSAAWMSGLASVGVFSIYKVSEFHPGDTPKWLFLALVVTLLTAAWHVTDFAASALRALKLFGESDGLGVESIEGAHQSPTIPKTKGEERETISL